VERKDRTQRTPPGLQVGLDAYLPPDEELLARFGDAIDDRIAETVDELLEERNSARRHRPGRYISVVSLILAAVAASALLRHSGDELAELTSQRSSVWPAAAMPRSGRRGSNGGWSAQTPA
jgi:hypothetical protein